MNFLSRLFLLTYFLFIILNEKIYSQTNFSFFLTNTQPEFKVKTPAIQYEKQKSFDSVNPISRINSAFVQNRSYGTLGQVNTLSIDGGLSSHTKIGWNNTEINLPQNNTFDISLLPLEFATEYEIYRDNLSPYGINAQGGFINFLATYPYQKNGFLEFFTQSYSTYGGKILLKTQDENLKSVAGFSAIVSSNNFKYIDKYGFTNEAQNLDYTRYAIFSELYFPFASLSISHTYKNGGTGISYNTSGRQKDFFTIFSLSSSLLNTDLKANYIYWQNTYTLVGYYEDTHINHSVNLEAKKDFELFTLSNSFHPEVKIFWLESTKLSNHNSYETHLVYTLSKKIEMFSISYSSDLIYKDKLGFFYIPGLSGSFNIIEGINIYGSVSRGLLFPSFNDLYWPEDNFAKGNTNLKPEDGLRWQSGLAALFPPFYINLSYSQSFIENQIIWTPSSGKWQPENIGKVFSQIVNTIAKVEDQIGEIYYFFEVALSYNYSINNDPDSKYYQKRIIYSPLYKWTLKGNLEYKFISLNFSYRYISERFTTEENTVWLSPYKILDIYLKIFWFYFGVENLLDENYEEIESYPQPGRIFKAGIKIEF